MFQKTLKLMWNRRKHYTFLLLELFFSFLILFAVFVFMIYQYNRLAQPLGFNPKNVEEITANFDDIIVKMKLQNPEVSDSLLMIQLKENTKKELLSVPGVECAAFSSWQTPFSQSNWTSDNQTDKEGHISYTSTNFVQVDEDWLELYQLKMNQGSWFQSEMLSNKYLPIVVNQKFYDENMAGRFELGSLMNFSADNSHEIVGVVDRYKYNGEFQDEWPIAFVLLTPDNQSTSKISLKINTSENPNWPQQVNQILMKQFYGVSFNIENIDQRRQDLSRSNWILMISLLILAAFLFVNVAIGLFGALQYAVQKRSGEIGLRKAIGASNSSILSQFIGEMVVLSSFAILIGLLFVIQAPLLNLFNFEKSVYFQAISYSLIFIYTMVILCSFIPAFRAASVNPADVLHAE